MFYRVAGVLSEIKDGVSVKFENSVFVASGKFGSCSVKIPSGFGCSIVQSDKTVSVVRVSEVEIDKSQVAIWGCLTRKVANAINGCFDPYKIQLTLTGTGYKAQVVKILDKQFVCLTVGFSHDVYIEIPTGIAVNCPKATMIELSSTNKEIVGGFAASLHRIRPIEPYKGRGIYIVGKFVYRKEAKRK